MSLGKNSRLKKKQTKKGSRNTSKVCKSIWETMIERKNRTTKEFRRMKKERKKIIEEQTSKKTLNFFLR